LAIMVTLLVAGCLAAAGRADEPRPLFDGATLAGWETPAKEAKWWRVADGAIVGGALGEQVPHNTFLATTEAFTDFELQLEIRIEAGEGFVNSGVQIRSTRVPDSHEMCGYQVDAGDGWWGKLYDESRRNKVIAEPADQKAVVAAVKNGEWNAYRIVAEGPRIRSWINGVPALDYTEQDPSMARDGRIGLQVHGGGKLLVRFRNLTIRPLAPPVPMKRGKETEAELRTPAAEAATFSLPPGFTAELVLAESTDAANAYGKFVALAFDRHGRLWTTTALEYPLDANESPEASRRLFAAGGRDQVLVVDDPCAAKPTPPRAFAAGLAMPLGVLPWRDGAFVQYGSEIRFYRDTDGDGRADGHESVLEGFGTQDSHLFPHQFTRAPGGWILLAQGLFNNSLVKRPGGAAFADGATEVRFDACKLARFKPDGVAFEPLTAGPNNIWGLTISRTGETWLQEANDLGYPIFPYEPGVCVKTGSPDRLTPYQPMMPPPLAPPQMGGTGLSGLALADDVDGWPAPWGAGSGATDDERMFYVANAITNSIQSILATRSGTRYAYRKGPDLLTSGDKAFRPVAIQFGPDGCLYVVDWYNKIISHNEVPRAHPDRDKIRGRIWRIRHESQPVREPVAIARVATDDLPAHLGAKNARVADLAWQEIVDRDAQSLVPRLTAVAGDASAPTAARAGAVWALEGLGAATPALLRALASDPSADLRHEAVRIAAGVCSEAEFRGLAGPLVDDPAPRVRAALGDALRRIRVTEPDTVALVVKFGRGRVQGDDWTVYDRDFERFLARWAMETHAGRVASVLDSPAAANLPVESRLLALQAIDPRAAARALVRLLPALGRPPAAEEVVALALQADVPEIAAALERIVRDPATRIAALRALLAAHTSLPPSIEPLVSRAAADVFAAEPAADRMLALELAGAFKLRGLEPAVAALAAANTADVTTRRAALRALREMGSMSAGTARHLLAAAGDDPRLRDDVVAAWADSRTPETCAALVAVWAELTFAERQAAAAALARHREGARALVAGLEDESIDSGSLPVAVLADMRVVLGADAALERIWAEVTARAPQVLRLAGANTDAGPLVTLAGPFTVEAWINLEAPIGNEDSLLAADRVIDMNFCEGRFHVWTKAHGDVAIAKSRMIPDTWTHYAVTRDADGGFRIYIDGELDAEGRTRDTSPYRGARLGFSTLKAGGTHGRIAEFRVWDRVRTADEIRADFDRSYVGDAERPPALVSFHGGASWGDVSGGARVEPALDAPPLVTAAALGQRAEKFARFRELAGAGGDPANGQAVFASRCLTCHQQGGQGGRVGPALDGVGLTGVEAILRNVLTPSAAMEGGYRTYRVVTRDGRIVQGLLVAQEADAIVIRQPNTSDIRIPSRDVAQAAFTSVSVMPEGLLESLPPSEVSDLFAYLKTLGALATP
jgi:putative heme-binding domain-containing protein